MDGPFDPELLPPPYPVLGTCEIELVADLPIPGVGIFFDERVDMRDPEGAAFTARLLEIYDEVRPRTRKRGRAALTTRMRGLLANGMRARYFRTSPSVLYFGKADSPWNAEKPGWMRHRALANTVCALADAGLVHFIPGKRMPYYSKMRSYASSYTPTDELMRLAVECGVTGDSLQRRLPSEELVQLFGPKPKREIDPNTGQLVLVRKGERIAFKPTALTQKWAENLETINAFYRQQDLALAVTPAELARWLDARNAHPDRAGSGYILPELFKTDIYRVFNNGVEGDPKFDDGGRLFGGWWMSLPEGLRKAVTINGEATVELDYKECHPRMLYHQRGFDGDGELYALPEIAAYEEATGVPPGTYRPYVKWLTQVLINCRGRPQDVDKPDDKIIPPAFSAAQIIRFIEAKHRPIADAFKTGVGLKLMRVEADIALEIVATAAAEGWTVLPIHDSFIATADMKDRLKAIMIESYVRRLGRMPVFK